MASTITPSATPRPSALACHTCRHKHVKCDGVKPTCSRCATEAAKCIYTASRRGLARSHKRSIRSARSASSAPRSHPMAFAIATDPEGFSNSTNVVPEHANVIAIQAPASQTNPWTPSVADRERLISLFYIHFFGAHPFIVPRAFYDYQDYPGDLDLVVCFAGQHYTSSVGETTEMQSAVASAMLEEKDYFSPHRVQALILYGILLHSRHQPEGAGSCILRAAKIALKLGMNEPWFAQNHSGENAVVGESLRRTWWELYTVDVYVATIHRSPSCETSKAASLPLLPCDEGSYEAGRIDQQLHTLRQFENRVFSSGSPRNFSSYCYKIEAIRLVGRVLAHSVMKNPTMDDTQALTNALASWEYNLPASHADVAGSSGDVDLLLFQARCFVSCARLLLHFPQSELPPTIPSAKDVACARNYAQQASASREHTVKAIAASKVVTDLAAAPWPLDRHSPFLVCGLVIACIVQLAAASIHFHDCVGECLSQHRDRVTLLLGALGRLGERWPLARNAVQKLKLVAETIFVTSEGMSNTPSVNSSLNDSGVDVGEYWGDMPWLDLISPEIMLPLPSA